MRIAVAVVVGPGRPTEGLRRCFDSLAAQTRLPDELVIIGNGEPPPITRVAGIPSRVTVLRENRGWRGGRNHAAAVAQSELIVFVDDDGFLNSSCIASIERAAFVNPECFGFAGCVIDPADELPLPAGAPWQTVLFSGGAFAAWRTAFIRLGGYDERFASYGEEYDLALRAFKRGLVILRVPTFVLFHHRRDSARGDERELINAHNRAVTEARRFPRPVAAAAVVWKIASRSAFLLRERKWRRLTLFLVDTLSSASKGWLSQEPRLSWSEFRGVRGIIRTDSRRRLG